MNLNKVLCKAFNWAGDRLANAKPLTPSETAYLERRFYGRNRNQNGQVAKSNPHDGRSSSDMASAKARKDKH